MIRLFSACVLLCAFLISPASAQDFLDGVVSINVTLTREESRQARCALSGFPEGGKTGSGSRAPGSREVRRFEHKPLQGRPTPMNRFIIFALLFPPIGMLVFQSPDLVSKGIPASEEWLAWVISSYPIAIVPALLMAWVDQVLSKQPLHPLKTTAVGGLASLLVLVFLGGLSAFWSSVMAILLGAVPAAVCSWLSDKLHRQPV
ncbi:hypothetical protein [Tardiphaga sp. 285_C5_N1_2]|uniref:hypothetical protein n=1 Tax=Tardiphaga sp. 285_C5_N1_2 TaxID=3240775 RepID=UPI003F8CAE27